MMRKPSTTPTTKVLCSIFFIALLSGCSKEETTAPQYPVVETVSIDEALNFLKSQPSSELAKPDTEPYASFSVKQLTQEKINNSAALLTVIPATTLYKDHYSRLLLLKINTEIQGVLFSMYPSAASTDAQFSGELIITDLEGGFLNGYRVINGSLSTQFVKTDSSNVAQKTSNVVCPDHGDCVAGSNCIFCLQELDEVVVTGGSGGTGGIIPITGLYDYDAMEPGGGTGPDMGMGWDYGLGEGGSSNNDENIVFIGPDTPIDNINDYLECFDPTQGAKITIYIDQPIANSNAIASTGDKAGHAFISISQNGNTSVFGFYPVNSADPLFNYSQPSTMGNDSNHAYDVSISKNINSSTLQSVLNHSLNYTSTYDLYNYNCTDFVIEIGNFLGMGLPDCYSSWGIGGGSNPGKLGQYIRNNFTSNAIYTVNKNGGTSSANNKGC